MSSGDLIAVTAGVGVVVLAAQVGLRRLIRNLEGTRSERSDERDESLAGMIVRREREEGARFEADVLFFAWPILLGLGFALVAGLGAWGVGWVAFGALLAMYAALSLLARIRYGKARLKDVRRLMRERVFRRGGS